MNKLAQKNNAQAQILVAIFVIMSAGIIIAGYVYYSQYKIQCRAEAEAQLSAIGKLKVGELANWRKERLGDGKVFYKKADFSALVSRYFADPNNEDVRGQIKVWLDLAQTSYQYDRLMLLDNQYRKRIIIPESVERPVSYVSEQTSKLLQSGEMAFEDFYWNEENKQTYLKILVPIQEKDSGKVIGVLAIRINPETYLYPFIENMPVPSFTAETLLVRRDGNDVQYLNALKFEKCAALKLKRSLKDKDLPAAKAVLGSVGIVDGIDYRGMPVIADVRAVPDSPWYLVTRIDLSEVYAPLKQRFWAIIIFIGTLLAGAGAGVGFLWKRRTASFYCQKYGETKEWNKTFDAITDLVSVVDRDHRIKTVNKAFADVFGKRPEELIGMRCCELVHGTKEPPENCPLRKTLSTGETAKVEIFYDALRKHLEISTCPVFDDNGEIVETVHFMRDITMRKLMEAGRRKADTELRDALRFNQEVISNASVGLIVYDTQLQYVEWNAFMENLTGIKKKDVIGKSALEIFPHLREQGIDKLLARALAGETVTSEDVKYQCGQTGKSNWIACTYTPHRNSSGQIIGAIGIIRDITKRKQAEIAMKQSEEALRQILDVVSFGVMIVGKDKKIRQANKAACKIAGYDSVEEMKGVVCHKNLCPAEKDKCPILDLHQTVDKSERMMLTRNGGQIPILKSVVPIILNGEEVLLESFIDITDRKQVEESLKTSETMFKSIATAVPVGLGMASDRTIQWVNDYLLQLLGRKRDEVVGNDTRIFYENDEGYNLVGNQFYNELSEKGRAEIEVNWKHKDGRILNIFLTGATLDRQDISGGIVFSALDITGRKQAEEELHKSAVGIK